jgi:uncharacterized protein (DUF58 family)
MEYVNNIVWYYSTESKHAYFMGAGSGVILLLAAIIIITLLAPSPILKGLALALLIGGLMFFTGGFFAGRSSQKSLQPKVESYNKDQKRFITEEYIKVEKTHKGWLPIRIFWSLVIALGVALLLFTSLSFWVGVAMGALIVGTLGHVEEAISYQHNEKYRKEVHKEKSRLEQSTASLDFKF